MAANKIDWSQYEIKGTGSGRTDWSQYEVKDNHGQESSDEGFPGPEATGLSGIGSDVLEAAFKAKDFVEDIPNKLEKSGQYIQEHPGSSILHNVGQLGAEGSDIAK